MESGEKQKNTGEENTGSETEKVLKNVEALIHPVPEPVLKEWLAANVYFPQVMTVIVPVLAKSILEGATGEELEKIPYYTLTESQAEKVLEVAQGAHKKAGVKITLDIGRMRSLWDGILFNTFSRIQRQANMIGLRPPSELTNEPSEWSNWVRCLQHPRNRSALLKIYSEICEAIHDETGKDIAQRYRGEIKNLVHKRNEGDNKKDLFLIHVKADRLANDMMRHIISKVPDAV